MKLIGVLFSSLTYAHTRTRSDSYTELVYETVYFPFSQNMGIDQMASDLISVQIYGSVKGTGSASFEFHFLNISPFSVVKTGVQ
jgi:hypothetical protein